jgi:hypothetical protein
MLEESFSQIYINIYQTARRHISQDSSLLSHCREDLYIYIYIYVCVCVCMYALLFCRGVNDRVCKRSEDKESIWIRGRE